MTPKVRDIGAEACRALEPGQVFRLRVSGRSMEPVLREGDEIEAERLGPRGPRLGDLVVIDLPGAGLVVHRLLWRSRSAMRTWGDGSRRMDPPLAPRCVLGRVRAATRDGAPLPAASPGALGRSLRWLQQFAAAALHRMRRRFGPERR